MMFSHVSRAMTATRILAALLLIPLTLAAGPWTYAALGDSYASGDGAGSSKLLPNFDALCGRFSDAYPVQVANDSRADISRLRNLSCGGAVTVSVLNTQVPFIGNSDVITIQVGGNEIDFFLLLNECIYQWHPFSICASELTRARGLVQSQTFLANFNTLVSQTSQKIHDGAVLVVLGYAQFFNQESDQCDHVSFSHTNSSNVLTKSIRKQLNDIVRLLNNVIKAVADTHGARYIDVDGLFKGHRFCETGAIEPVKSISWFFSDGKDQRSLSRSSFVRQPIQYVLRDPFRGFLDFTRTFHPTSEGHSAIAAEIVRQLTD